MTQKDTPKQTAIKIAMSAKMYNSNNIETALFAVNVMLDYINPTNDSEYFKKMNYWQQVKDEIKKL